MPNKKNTELVQALIQKIKRAKSIVLTDYKGLKSNQANELRGKISEADAEVEVAKNTLLKVALKENGIQLDEEEKALEGSTLAILSYQDPIAPIKKLFEFIKSTSLPTVKLGFVEGRTYSGEEVELLSKLPAKPELIAKVLAGFNSPISGFVNVLSGTKRNFVQVLNAIAEKKGQAA